MANWEDLGGGGMTQRLDHTPLGKNPVNGRRLRFGGAVFGGLLWQIDIAGVTARVQ
ncbi:MAG: hypothetical protein AB8B91_17780 [Rubripirellula sp.]